VADGDEIRCTEAEDSAFEAAVLRRLLSLHPTQVTLAELTRELSADSDDFAERDAVERAVDELARAGLLHRNNDLVFPSRAALRFEELLDSG
jgi:hypothetical protein